MPPSAPATLRQRAYRQLDPRGRIGIGLSAVNMSIVLAILVSVAAAIIQTEPSLPPPWPRLLDAIDFAILVLFCVEYAARLWTAAEALGEGSISARRWRHVCSPSALLDLVVVLAGIAPAGLPNLAVLRFARLIRIARLGRLGHFSRAIDHLRHTLVSSRHELVLTLALAVMLLIVGASALYWADGAIQPAKFGSIPRALWWAVVTLTTIGYGDVYPVTPLGKVIAGVVAMAGVGLVALRTGILAAEFRDAIERDRARSQPRDDAP